MILKYIIVYKNGVSSPPMLFEDACKEWKARKDECLYLTVILEKNNNE